MRTNEILLLTALTTSCAGEHHAPPPAEALPTANVEVLEVTTEPFRATEPVAGTVRAKLTATLAAKIPGRVTEMSISVGDRVKKGQVLARLEAQEIQARLQQAKAVRDRAKAELERYESLQARGAATRQELEGRRTQFAVSNASVREASSMLQNATVRAPFDGVVVQDMAEVGDLATPGRPLLMLEAPGGLRLEVAVSETLVGFLAVGQTVPIQLEGDRTLEGQVAVVSPSADANSRTYLVKIDLPDDKGLRSGQFGRALVPTRRSEILQVPANAVIRRGQLELVFVAEDGQAKLRLVKTGKQFGEQVEVVAGLASGEKVVLSDVARLRDGQPIAVQGATP